jgi:uncharacterized membrane protein YhiD involved in acid resistance
MNIAFAYRYGICLVISSSFLLIPIIHKQMNSRVHIKSLRNNDFKRTFVEKKEMSSESIDLLKKIIEVQRVAFQNIDENFTSVNEKINHLDSRVSNIESKLNSLSKDTSSNITDVKNEIESGFKSVHIELKKINTVTNYGDQILNFPNMGES